MALTQWYDIGGVIVTIFVRISAMLALVVHLEQRLATSDPPQPEHHCWLGVRQVGR